MLADIDVEPITAALDDPSPLVRHAALRVMRLLLPVVSGERVRDRLQGMAQSGNLGAVALLADAALGASRATPAALAEAQAIRDDREPATEDQWVAPERWRESFNSATSVLDRLFPAVSLATVGEPNWIERVLEEVERGPLNLKAIQYVREERPRLLPRDGAERLLRIAGDLSRRGDVRLIAWLLAQRSADAGHEPPPTPELIDNAAQVAEECLRGPTAALGGVDIEALRYLDPERAALLIVVLFERCLREAFEDQGYMAGNDVVRLVAALGRNFVADVPALFELYLDAFRRASAARAEWYRTGDENIVYFSGSGHLAVGWQIAWTLSRAGLLETIAGLLPFLDSAEPDERHAALELLEDVIRYLPVAGPALFGGVSTPATDAAVLVEGIRSTLVTAPTGVGYKTVPVFYGTNRKPTGSVKPGHWFGTGEADLGLGICEVSIPETHEIGALESPAWYTLGGRLDPSRHIVLQTIDPQPESVFRGRLEERLRSSKDRHALVFVHGYRVSFADAARRTAQLAEDLEIETALFYSWPSTGSLRGYAADETLAQRAVPKLVRFLDLIAAQEDAEVIHLIAHSLGSLALSRAVVDYLQAHASSTRPKFREIILAAPYIDAEIFKDQIVPRIAGKGPRMTLYASRRDYALLTSRWLRSGLTRAGFIEGGKPLVVAGVETVDVSAVNSELAWGLLQGHSYIGDRPAIVQDMFELLRLGKRAADRFGNRQAVLDDLPYWIMKPRAA